FAGTNLESQNNQRPHLHKHPPTRFPALPTLHGTRGRTTPPPPRHEHFQHSLSKGKLARKAPAMTATVPSLHLQESSASLETPAALHHPTRSANNRPRPQTEDRPSSQPVSRRIQYTLAGTSQSLQYWSRSKRF